MFANPANWSIVGGLALGAVFGLVVWHQRMCLVAAVGNVSLVRDYRYALAFAVAILVAITGTQLLEMLHIVDISKTSYRGARFDWIGLGFGGVVFGFGAALAGGDAARIVVLAGQGSRSGWVAVFFFMVFAVITQLGIFAGPREYSLSHNSITLAGGDAGIAAILSLPSWLVLCVVDLGLLAFIASKWKHHAQIKLVIAGLILGLTVIGAWYTTGVLANDEFNPIPATAITVSGPMWKIGNTLISGDKHPFDLQICFVLGMLAASFLAALLTRRLSFSPMQGSAGLVAFGGALMGIGGTFAYGCNIGQGFSGISTLSLGSILAVVAMIAGIHLGTRWLERRHA
jgi:uncharacterized membrane protein YedE/YeeE